jgi:hypothetical protein
MTTPPPFWFVIPFLARSVARDWDGAVERLMHTLANCLDFQTQPEHTHVVLSVHDLPQAVHERYSNDPRVHVIYSPMGPPLERRPTREVQDFDKLIKLKVAAIHIGSLNLGSSHLMMLDADDLVRQDFVEIVRRIAPTANVIIRNGYMLDMRSSRMYKLPPEVDAGFTFDNACGSSGVLYMLPDDFPTSLADGGVMAHGQVRNSRLFNQIRGHKRWEETFKSAGRPYVVAEEYLAIYVKEHGSNITGVRRDGQERKIALPEAPGLMSTELAARITERFGFTDLYAK